MGAKKEGAREWATGVASAGMKARVFQLPYATLAGATEALASVGSYAKNFLPILFNVHQAEPPERRGALQETIGAFASVCPAPLLAVFLP